MKGKKLIADLCRNLKMKLQPLYLTTGLRMPQFVKQGGKG